MNRMVTSLILAMLFNSAMAQVSQAPSQRHRPTIERPTLSSVELHDVARRVTVLISERNAQGETSNIGSGVWLAEGLVATCWHVVKNKKGVIKISLGSGDVVTFGEESVATGNFLDYTATVVASDHAADVAILKTEQNPFKSHQTLVRTPKQEIKPKLGVARIDKNIPAAGTLTVLSGYPLSGWDLVSQTGNIAGTSVVPPNAVIESGNPIKGVRIMVSVVSNPGNSGGPVLDEHGSLIGIQEGNLPSPVKDETPTQAVYLRPKKDAAGNVLQDAQGRIQMDAAPMFQNSGISLVVPASMITPLLKQAQATK